MTLKHLQYIKSDLKHYNEPFEHTFDQKCNVYCVRGGSGSGKTSLENSVRLALIGRVWFDVLGKEIKDPKMIDTRLNQGEGINIELRHNKGESNVAIKADKFKRYKKAGWRTGYEANRAGNLAATLKDILSRTPKTMVKMLVDLVVAGVTKKELLALVDNEGAQNLLAMELSKDQSPVGALNATIESIKAKLKDANTELKPLLMANDPGAYEVSQAVVEAATEERDFWVTQRGLLIAANKLTDAQEAEVTLREEVVKTNIQIGELLMQLNSLPAVDVEKIEAYHAGAALCDFAGFKGMTKCPICTSTEGMEATAKKKGYSLSEDGASARYFSDKSSAFRGLATHANTDPNSAARNNLQDRIERLRESVGKAEFALKRMGSVLSETESQYDSETIESNITRATEKLEGLKKADTRYKLQQDRTKKIEHRQSNIVTLEKMQASLEKIKRTLVDGAFGEFIERARYFMPDTKALKGGIFHFNLDKREVGFIRNGRLDTDPSGSELRVIVTAMALAAGSAMREPPPIFLDDVGWGVDLLEASLNAWTKYGGIVWVSATAKVRGSKVNDKVEIIDVNKVTTHTKLEIEAIQVERKEVKWVSRPETNYETSMFANAVLTLPEGARVIVGQKHRVGKGSVMQEFMGQVLSASSKNVTVLTDDGSGFTFSKKTGTSPFDKNSVLLALTEADLLAHYKQILVDFLSYSPSWSPRLDQAEAIWENQISADDLQNRRDLVPE